MDKLIALHKLVKSYYKTIAWSHTTLGGFLYGETKYKMGTKLAEDNRGRGTRIGGAPRLVWRRAPGG